MIEDNRNNVIVTPCSVSLAIRQSPDIIGYLTQHQKPLNSRVSIYYVRVFQISLSNLTVKGSLWKWLKNILFFLYVCKNVVISQGEYFFWININFEIVSLLWDKFLEKLISANNFFGKIWWEKACVSTMLCVHCLFKKMHNKILTGALCSKNIYTCFWHVT